jgi:hypothetical protein
VTRRSPRIEPDEPDDAPELTREWFERTTAADGTGPDVAGTGTGHSLDATRQAVHHPSLRGRPNTHRWVQTQTMIDASDKRLLAWLAELPPRQELVVRMALNGRSKNQ